MPPTRVPSKSSPGKPSSSPVFLLALGAVLLVVFLAFLPCLNSGFLRWDDNKFLTENTLVRFWDIPHLIRIFTSTVLKVYVPLTLLSFSAEYHFFGYQPLVYHLTNIFLHVLICGLVCLLGLRLGLNWQAACLSALVFGIHPMRVEVVAWISERKTLLYSLFYLGAVIAYLRFLATKDRRYYLLSLGSALLSILSKPMALSLPVVLLLVDWFRANTIGWKQVKDKIPFLAIVAPISGITYLLNARIPFDGSVIDGVLIWLWTATFYIKKFLLPWPLVPIYELPKPVSLGNISYLSALLIFIIAAVTAWRWRNNRWYLFALLFYVFSVFFLWRYDEGTDLNIVADRFMYLPSLGFCFLLGKYGARVFEAGSRISRQLQGIFAALLIGLAVVLFSVSFKQCLIWQDGIRLWDHVIRHSPHHVLPYFTRGDVYLGMKKYDLAMADFDRALMIGTDPAKAHYDRGLVFDALGKKEAAIAEYSKALLADPRYINAYKNRGAIYIEIQQYKKALQDFETALGYEPRRADCYYNRSVARFYLGHYPQALADISRALQLDPDDAISFVQRAVVLSVLGQYPAALTDYQKALSIDRGNGMIYLNRAQTHLQMGEYGPAWDDVLKAKALGESIPEGLTAGIRAKITGDVPAR